MPHPNPKGRPGPTAGRLHIHPHTTYPSTDLPEERSTEDPRAPLLRAVCVSPSSQQPHGSGDANARKTPSLPARMKIAWSKLLKKYMQQTSSPLSWNP